jgi:hypothetical protein
MTRLFALLFVLSAVNANRLGAQQTTDRFAPSARVREYAVAMIDPVSWGSVAGSTLLDQLGDNPESWDFSDRLLSNSARFVLEVSIYHGVAAFQDRSTWYYPCECQDIPGRTVHAFAEAFIDHDRSGAAHVSAARIGSPYGAAVAEALWRPDVSLGDAVMTGSSSLIFTGLFNIVREFLQ